MKFEGTKGNWYVDKRAALRIVGGDKGYTVASASAGQSGDNREEEMANAKLISAAPSLFCALLAVREDLIEHGYSIDGSLISEIDNALNKAIGKS